MSVYTYGTRDYLVGCPLMCATNNNNNNNNNSPTWKIHLSASEVTYIVSVRALNSTHSLTPSISAVVNCPLKWK